MRKLALTVSLLAILAGVAGQTAQAHFLWHHKHMTLDQKIVYFKRSVHHDKTALIWLTMANKEAKSRRVIYAVRFGLYKETRWHRAALKWHNAQLTRYERRWQQLHPPPPRPSVYATYSSSGWLCIHNYEGAWNANTGNGYYGGLQMDYSFMATYGADLLRSKGTADHWTPQEQMAVAEKAKNSGRGYYPWPNTARICGLIGA